jgi:RHS repeat-associated protein
VAFARDAVGRITEERHGDGRQVCYRYDRAGQLVAIDDGLHRWRFGWDPAGRLEVEDGPIGPRHYCYDEAGQLVTVDSVLGVTRFDYDACGRRISEDGPGGARRYLYDPVGRLTGIADPTVAGAGGVRVLSYDPAGRLTAVDGTPLEDHLAAIAGDDLSGLVDGPRGEPPGLDPWGAPLYEASGAGPAHPRGVSVGHRGQLCVEGLVWLGARFYDPTTRAFLSPDPLPAVAGPPWATNPYSYAANDPVNHSDPTGLRPLTDTDLAAIADRWGSGAWDRYGGYALGGLAIAGGAALIATGVGGVPGAMLLGATLAGGISAGSQQALTGRVDWARVGVDTLIGTASGGLASGVASLMPNAGNLGVRVLAGGGTGIVESVAGGVVARGYGGQDPLDPAGLLIDAGLGVAIGGGAGALSRPLSLEYAANTPGPFSRVPPLLTDDVFIAPPPGKDKQLLIERYPRNPSHVDRPSSGEPVKLRVDAVNPFGHPKNPFGHPNSGGNCIPCAIATDATLAGYPASALPMGTTGTPTVHLDMAYGTRMAVGGIAHIAQLLGEAGPGARAIIGVFRNGYGYGHVLNAVNVVGKVVFVDGQAGKSRVWVESLAEAGRRTGNGDSSLEYNFWRTDLPDD